jgi:hypothetical protein
MAATEATQESHAGRLAHLHRRLPADSVVQTTGNPVLKPHCALPQPDKTIHEDTAPQSADETG